MAAPLIPFEEISLRDENIIGAGFYGRVYKTEWLGRTIAVKVIGVGMESQQIEREVNQLSNLEHENIIRLYGISMHGNMFHLLEEYAEGGALSTLIHSDLPNYTLAHAFNWAHQIAKGLAYLHARTPRAVIHRDIKPNNVVLSQQGLSLKICDFGTVVNLATSMTADVGTCLYKAPEVFQGRKYNEKCDVHSWAITFWEILSRENPFKHCRILNSVVLAVIGGTRPPVSSIRNDCPEDIINLITACWDSEPSRRYSMRLVANIMNGALTDAGPFEPLNYNP
ncbi:mitogen-activated protein kinase kinase kinase 7 [Drosophila kikkawai]|uniref:Mitogen-activated protein kinase kinase kinase 7 n=1 Tax=Drosophila kikkawai TaxID=30033 RepID=A0A6P4JK92_DROKI|nr:mitogen-activated protein kinase kinase kinase 7 [Drosophila kikkawai]XP_017035070.1 mitogen-activated protein kinase kinase kinase 7 [Drosophila kikkawai]